MITFDLHAFAAEVRKTRETMNMNRTAFARLCNISKGTLERVEHGQSYQFWVGVQVSYVCSINVHQYILHYQK